MGGIYENSSPVTYHIDFTTWTNVAAVKFVFRQDFKTGVIF